MVGGIRVRYHTYAGASVFFIHSKRPDFAATLANWEGGADIILSTASSVESANAAATGLARNGTLVLLGAGPGDVTVNPMVLALTAMHDRALRGRAGLVMT